MLLFLSKATLSSIKAVLMVGCLWFAGCGPTIVQNKEPVEVRIKVSSGGKPLDKVTLSLQPISEGALQAQARVERGECTAMVVPGTYTYYVESGESQSELQRIPAPFRQGSMDRKLEITTASSHELQMN